MSAPELSTEVVSTFDLAGLRRMKFKELEELATTGQ